MIINIFPLARQDVLQQFMYLNELGGSRIADEFLDAYETSLAQLETTPHIGSPRQSSNPEFKEIRRWTIPNFDAIGIYYQVCEEEIQIIRVLHEKRNVGGILQLDDLLMDGLPSTSSDRIASLTFAFIDRYREALNKLAKA